MKKIAKSLVFGQLATMSATSVVYAETLDKDANGSEKVGNYNKLIVSPTSVVMKKMHNFFENLKNTDVNSIQDSELKNLAMLLNDEYIVELALKYKEVSTEENRQILENYCSENYREAVNLIINKYGKYFLGNRTKIVPMLAFGPFLGAVVVALAAIEVAIVYGEAVVTQASFWTSADAF